MASHILNALTLRHDHDAAERTLHHFWDTKDLFDSELIEEHIASQPLLAASLFSLVACSLGLLIFAVVFLTCRIRGQCGAQKYQEYPSNSTNYAIYLMLFFISWLIVTATSAYFVLAGSGFWSEKLDAKTPVLTLSNSSLLRLSRSTISDLFANSDYLGDFESVSEAPKLRRIHIKRPRLQTFRKRIEIPLRPLAEVIFNGGASDKFIVKNNRLVSKESKEQNEEEEDEEEDELFDKEGDTVVNLRPEIDLKAAQALEIEKSGSEELEEPEQILVVTGETMVVEKEEYDVTEEEEDTTTVTTTTVSTTTVPPTTTTTTTVPPTITVPTTTVSTTQSITTSTTTVPTTIPSTTTTMSTTTKEIPKEDPEEIAPKRAQFSNSREVLEQLLSVTPSDEHIVYNSNLTFFSLHSRFLVFICRLTFCFVALALALVILPSFFLVVAGTGCYIYSDHPMNRSSVSNKIGRAISVNASLLLFLSPCLLIFSAFSLFYTHSHELLCATIQLQHQQANGLVENNHQSLLETYSINSNHCSRSLAPIQSLLLSSLLLCISLLPCVFAMFKLVKYYFRMSSEFYWNAADNYAGRQFSKQQEFPRYQSTVIYPDDEVTPGYAVYGQI